MPPPPRGPGDDAALSEGRLLTADALCEGVHFERSEPAFLIGRKALAVNLSDVAAMGGRPTACLLTLALPQNLPESFFEAFADGFASAAAEEGVEWIGGDIVRSAAGMAISVTLVGVPGAKLLSRSGARPGDGLYVSGPLGASAGGRALLTRGWRVRPPNRRAMSQWHRTGDVRAGRRLEPLLAAPRRGSSKSGRGFPRPAAAVLIARHLDPGARLAEAAFLAGGGVASAAMDLSDGLGLDLARLCEASGTGALVLREALPVSREARLWAARAGEDPFDLAAGGGEDYELLFTVPPSREPRLRGWPAGRGTGPFLIGRIRPRAEGLRVVDAAGRTSKMRLLGYDAFRLTGR